ncbi:MAG: rhomboid family intramembrane serine protease [Pseudomonadales bacterium]
MIPIRDDNPQLRTPVATYALIGLNVISWLLLQGAGTADALQSSVCQFGLIPADLLNSEVTRAAFCPNQSGWSGVFSSMFMHGSWMHIIGNMWFLWIFGDNVEDAMGPVRFVVFYLLCGVGAAAAQVVADVDSTVPMVGASGAIGGVMGAYIMLYPRVKVHLFVILVVIFTTFRVPAIAMLGYWIIVQLVGGFASLGSTGGGVAFWAHVGGFAAGCGLVWLFKDDVLLKSHPSYGWKSRHPGDNLWGGPWR